MAFSSSQYLKDSSKEYAIYVCDSRGIPLVSDGLKHGQRMALWLLRNRAEKIKTYALTGLLGYEKLYVHGEASANGAIGLMAAPFKNNVCLIEGHGQFGSRVAPDKEGIGAPRYTEIRRAKGAEAFLYNDLDLVPVVDNYDHSNKQPVTFLPLIPVVLLNGVSGVAVGWSTEILPRSLKSLVEACIAALKGEEVPVLVPHYQRYKVTTKATGKANQWEISGRAEIVDSSTVRITELPPGLSVENFRKYLNEMEENDTIQNYTERSSDFIDITIKMKRGSVKDWTEDAALDFFKIREKVSERIVVVDWSGDAIRTYPTAESLIGDFVAWRLAWYTKRFEKLSADACYQLRYWKALKYLFEANFTKKLGTFANRTEMQNDVMVILTKKMGKDLIDGDQLDKIVSLPTYRWTKEFATEIEVKIGEVNAAIASHNDILASPEKLRQIYIKELEELRTFKV